jgi:hypothetical protein
MTKAWLKLAEKDIERQSKAEVQPQRIVPARLG